jgi:hypothetical protein
MPDTCQIVGASVLATMGIVSELFHQMPIHRPVRDWMFPRSVRRRSRRLFGILSAITLPLFLAAWAVAVTGNYFDAKLLFFFAWLSATFCVWVGFVILTWVARLIWTAIISVLIAIIFFFLYSVLCPTVSISPKHVMFASRFDGDNGVSESYSFRIQNRIDDDIYSIAAKLRIDAPNTTEIFHIATPGARATEVMYMVCTDRANRPVFEVIISHLRPRDSQEITLMHVNPKAEGEAPNVILPQHIAIPNHENGIQATGNIIGFSYAEDQLGRPGLTLIPFRNDETLKCTGMGGGTP